MNEAILALMKVLSADADDSNMIKATCAKAQLRKVRSLKDSNPMIVRLPRCYIPLFLRGQDTLPYPYTGCASGFMQSDRLHYGRVPWIVFASRFNRIAANGRIMIVHLFCLQWH